MTASPAPPMPRDDLSQANPGEVQHQRRFMARVLVLLMASSSLTVLLPWVTGNLIDASLIDTLALALFLVMGFAAYVINQRVSTRAAAYVFLAATAVVTYSSAIPDGPTSSDIQLLSMAAGWVLIATIFLPPRQALYVAAAHSVAIVVFAYLAPGVYPEQVFSGPFVRYLLMALLALLVMNQRSELEVYRSQRVRDNEQRLRTITETMRDAIFMSDMSGRIIYATGAAHELFGLSAPLDGQTLDTWLANVHADDLVDFQEQVVRIKESHSSSAYQYRYLRPGRSVIWVETLSSLVRNEARLPIGLIFVSRNITERKRAEEQRLELGIQRERLHLFQRFISDVSHDLRTPLAVISTSLYLVRRKMGGQSEIVQPHIDSIQTQISHLEKQLDNLTTLSRLDNEQTHYRFESMALNAPLEALAREFSERSAERGLSLKKELTDAPVRILVSEVEFMQALRQIMTNALQYTTAPGTITLRSSVQDQQALIQIVDTGVGISSSDLERIFEPLYRADRARNIDSGGMGLGLSVTRKIIEAHAGTIDVTSEVGSGTVFSVRMPALLEVAEFYRPS